MTVARLAVELKQLSDRMDERFARVDARFEQIDARFLKVEARLERFADRVEVLMENLRAEFRVALDGIIANTRRPEGFERENAEEHRGMQSRIDDLEVKFESTRRPRRRPS